MGVFAALRRNLSVLLSATVMVVQLKMPLSGTSRVVSAVMFICPYEPSLPDEKVWPAAERPERRRPKAIRRASIFIGLFRWFFYHWARDRGGPIIGSKTSFSEAA